MGAPPAGGGERRRITGALQVQTNTRSPAERLGESDAGADAVVVGRVGPPTSASGFQSSADGDRTSERDRDSVQKEKKEKKNKVPFFRKTLGKQFGRSRPRRLPPTLADLMRRAKPLKKASHLAAVAAAAAAHTPTSTIPTGRVLRRSPNAAAACFGNQNAHQVIPKWQNVQ